jgi:RimJ/RimL family protein N-acetyltransferase
MRYIPEGAVGEATAARMLGEYARAQDELGFSVWAVVLRADGSVIGDAGFGVNTTRGQAPAVRRPGATAESPGPVPVTVSSGELELGWTLLREHWGRGYATEAARACLAAAFAHLPVERVVALVDVDNEPSKRVAAKIGMVPLQTIDAHGRPHVLFECTRRTS